MALSVFDASFYRAANSDLRGLSDAQALSHFQNYGLNEGRSFSPLIDLNFYRASNSDLANFSNRQAYEHLSNYGVSEGRKFSPFVDLDFYRRHNSDLGSFNNEQLFQHLQSYGVGEGRFTVGKVSNFSLTSDGNADIQLLDGNGNSIATGLYNNTTSETINLSLNSGTYYIYLNSESGANTNYNLAVSNTPRPLSSQVFKSTDGYGLVDAGVAVARAIGQSAFANVPNLGGYNSGNDLTHVPEAWARGYTGKGVTVAVLDSGVDYNHADLKDNIWTNPKEISGNGKDDDGDGYIDDVYGWNFADNNNNVLDEDSHGTLVSGTIAEENNGFGVTGVAYDAKILPVKVLNNDGLGSYRSIVNGIYYAVNHGANVINLSLGGDSGNDFLRYAIQYASSKGVIVVMAAGNESASTPDYPARYAKNWGIAVGAVDNNKNFTNFSNKAGSDPLDYVTAPGVNVYSTIPGNNYTFYSGTSTATPFISGIVALMLSANPSLTPTQVRDILINSAIHTT